MHVWDFLSQTLWKCSISSLKVSDEDEILPPKLQAALMQILEERNEILAQEKNFSQGMGQVVWGLKVKAVTVYLVNAQPPAKGYMNIVEIAYALRAYN